MLRIAVALGFTVLAAAPSHAGLGAPAAAPERLSTESEEACQVAYREALLAAKRALERGDRDGALTHLLQAQDALDSCEPQEPRAAAVEVG